MSFSYPLIWFLIQLIFPVERSSIQVDFSKQDAGIQNHCRIQQWLPGAKLTGGKIDKLKFLFFTSLHENIKVVEGPEKVRVLQLTYPEKRFGPVPGLSWKVPMQSGDSAFCEIELYIDSNFNFVKGGKLIGFTGGQGNTGGLIPNGYDGFSVRIMFWDKGRLCLYLYHPDQPGKFGDTVFFRREQSYFSWPRGQWLKLGLLIGLNQPGIRNGFVCGLVNGRVLARKDGLRFRETKELRLDHFLINYFFGGDSPAYAPSTPQMLWIKQLQMHIKNKTS